MLTMRIKRFIKKTRRKLDLNGKETVGFDRTKGECYNCHRRGHFTRECRALRNQGNGNRDAPTRNAPVDTSTTNALVVQDGLSKSKIFLSKTLKSVKNALKEKDDLKLKLENFETSSKNLTKLINSQISATDNTGLGYVGQINDSDLNDIHVNESDVLNNVFDSRESDGDDNQVNDRFKRKLDSEDENVFKPKEVKKTVKPSLEKIKFVNARSTTIENENKAEKPRKFCQSPRVNAAKQSSDRAATSVSAAWRVNTAASRPNVNNALPTTYSYFKAHSPDQGIFNSGRSRHMTGNKSYLTDYQETDGGFVAFGGNAKGDFKLLNDSQVLLKVLRNNNTYSFDLKNVVHVGGIENQIDHKVKTIRCNNGTEFKNMIMNDLCEMKGIRREFSVVRTPQQNEENLHITFLENKPNVAGIRPNWMFDIDTLTVSINYQPVFTGNQTNGNACTKANINAGQAGKKTVPSL
nr:ribonuclease H-like domain-containing protein [Tanacetum cinerariifolium]